MTQPLLSILIPTVVGREEQFDNLFDKLVGNTLIQSNVISVDNGIPIYCYTLMKYAAQVEIISYKDDKILTIGEKRERLYKFATGTHSIQVDDDDELAPNAIELILEAIRSNPEIPCITFREKCLINGVYKSSNHSIKYNNWQDNADGYDYVRTPFYKDVIRTDLARKTPFEKIRWNEDERFSYAIKPLLTDEIHIDEELYIYIYEPKDSPNDRYGI